ncbi:acyl carrier protein, partial [Streptomyces sp. NRRL S-31]|uniref:acyl carrier protein n=1 Tax=Streptomyces sp. NRRL S-31 TaxID=1463898 RepID=UPI00055E21FF
RLDLAAYARHTPTPALLHHLVKPTRKQAGTGGPSGDGLAGRLAGLAPAERQREVLALVRTEAAAALGHSGPEAIKAHQAFKEVGFDSLAAVELRNRLTTATGVKLPATLVFDHPTPRRFLATAPLDRLGELGVLDRVLPHLGAGSEEAPVPADGTGGPEVADETESIRAMSVDGLLELALGGESG